VRASHHHTPRFLDLFTTGPIDMFPFTFILSPFLKNKKKMVTFPTSTVVASFPTTHLPPDFSSGDHLRFLRLRALARLCAPGYGTGVVLAARPHCRSRRWRPPWHLLLGLETARASRPCRTSRLHRGSTRLGAPSGRSSRQPSSWCSLLCHLPALIYPSRRLTSSSTRLT
jgi:hypothetical protein